LTIADCFSQAKVEQQLASGNCQSVEIVDCLLTIADLFSQAKVEQELASGNCQSTMLDRGDRRLPIDDC
jgi:hypothetical protein